MAREMKDSGVEWIGEIPKGWNVLRNKNCFICSKEVIGQDSLNTQLLSLTTHGVKKKNVNETAGKVPESYDTYQVVHKNDIIMCLFDLDCSAVFSGISFHEGMISPAYKILKCKKDIVPNYIDYWFKYVFDGRKFKHYAKNLRYTLNYDEFALLPIIVPLVSEQTKIADFLDKICHEIDSILFKTRASIEEYKKLKQAIITQAITKGVRGKREMKDSGSLWFGQIPSDWDMRKVKYIFKIQKDIAGEEGHTVLSITQKGIKPKDLSKNEGQLAENYSNYQLVHIDDFAMNHMDLLTGWVDISKYEGVTSPDYRVFQLINKDSCYGKYYLYLMQMCYTNRIFYGLGQGVSGLGRWRLQADKFLNFTIMMPDYEEQKEIADYLDNKVNELDRLIQKKEQYLTEIENYKKSLIYEYVTGKKEVPL